MRRGPAERQFGNPGKYALQPLDPEFYGGCVSPELLAKGDRSGVHEVGAAGLHDVLELALLLPETGKAMN